MFGNVNQCSRRLVISTWIVAGILVAAASPAQPPPLFTNVTAQTDLDGVVAFRLSIADVNGDL